MIHSALMRGWVRHRRYGVREHAFRYGVDLFWLDLSEIDGLLRARPLWSLRWPSLIRYRREDYLGPAERPLDTAVRDRVEERTGRRPEGPIRLLTQLRYFGFAFNPVSFYYCFDEQDRGIEAIVAEITNTPWGERHAYVLGRHDDLDPRADHHRFTFRKDFYVSPFFGMEQDYDWRFSQIPGGLLVHMRNYEAGTLVFDATMRLVRKEWSWMHLGQSLLRNPFMTGKTIAAIYWQALRLWLKRVPRHPHRSVVQDASR